MDQNFREKYLVKNESRSGLRRGILFPVMLLDEVEIPLEFEHLQAAHLMDWQPELDHAGFDQFIDDLAGVIGIPVSSGAQPSLAKQLPAPSPTRTCPTPEPEIEPLQGEVHAVLGGNNNLSALTVSPGPLVPAFSANTLNYTVNVGSNVGNVTVSATKADSNAVMSEDVTAAAGTATGHAPIQFDGPGSNTLIKIVVTAPNGTQKTYTVNMSRATLGGSARSTESFPYLSIGLGLLAAIGWVVYFAVFSQGPFPGKRDETLYRSPVQSLSPRTEVITPPLAQEPIRQPSAAPMQTKPTVKEEATGVKTEVTKPRPIAGPAKTITGKDGAPMVLIRAGEFWMGSPDSVPEDDEHPLHRVALDEFYMDKYEVTNRLFEKFVRERNYLTTAERHGGEAWAYTDGKWRSVAGANWRKPEARDLVFDSNRTDHPVVSVAWEDANAYCGSFGKRLPTEAEWEYAARAGTETEYWWGNATPHSKRVENFADESMKIQFPQRNDPVLTEYDDGFPRTAPIGSFGQNPWGLHDMLGNVREWVSDWYSSAYYWISPPRNPGGPSDGHYRVWRGGSWNDPSESMRSIRVAKREHRVPRTAGPDVGFRCAQSAI